MAAVHTQNKGREEQETSLTSQTVATLATRPASTSPALGIALDPVHILAAHGVSLPSAARASFVNCSWVKGKLR